MELYSLALIARWLIPLWLAGWLLLPASRWVFPKLPDGGLAAGRLLALMLVSLIAFWCASLHLASLSYSPILLMAFPCLIFIFSLRSVPQRQGFIHWVKNEKSSLIVSDAIFLLGFLFFVYLRLCQPEILEQEKPMDSAIIGVLARTSYLPAENPWFSGTPFTNYYYFGHFMAALLTRTFATPLPYAYNLLQPAFCAFFVSILWSLCAALTRSSLAGVLAMSLVALCGNYEPVRQLLIARQQNTQSWPLDWWSTSRVVPNTINEYPFFTLALGDAHAHFFGLVMGALFLCLCYCTISSNISSNKDSTPAIILVGITLGAIIMTNPWDAPLYFALCCLIFIVTNVSRTKQFHVLSYWTLSSITVASVFLLQFKPPTHGLALDLWFPPAAALLHWGGILIGAIYICLHQKKHRRIFFPSSYQFCILIIGFIALVAPCLFYIRGHFEGDLRHQDTVFKFWLQSWLLTGTAIASVACSKFLEPCKTWLEMFYKVVVLLLWLVPATCSWIVIKSRIDTSEPQGVHRRFSLDGARFLSAPDRQLVTWLHNYATSKTVIVEAVGRNDHGLLIGAYSEFGRISFLTGIPSYLGWPQHVAFWGIDQKDIEQRSLSIQTLYGQNNLSSMKLLKNKNTENIVPKTKELSFFSSRRGISPALVIWGELESRTFGLPESHLKPIAKFRNRNETFSITPSPSYAFTMPLSNMPISNPP